MLPAFAIYALLGESRLLAGSPIGRRARSWIDGQQEIARSLASGAIDGLRWCMEVERLARETELGEILKLVESSSSLRAAPAGGPNDPRKRFVEFRDKRGNPRRLAFAVALFDFDPVNVVTPHAHRNMVSAHLVVRGAFRVRNFDRVADEAGHIRIRPTRDYVAGPGDVSTMCSSKDNVHWFVPQGGPATTFDVIVSGLDPAQPDHVIEAVDPVGGRKLADGSILAPIIGFAEASRRYTASV